MAEPMTLMQKIISGLLLTPFAYLGYLEMQRRARIAQEMAVEWLKEKHPGCIVASMKASLWYWPVRVVMQVYTPKDEDFEIKLKAGSFIGGIFNDPVEIVYIRKKKPASDLKEKA
ncbi:hypothetical protein ACPRNU_01200 [Chromobacterium vaccinii]|uniref:hypothetical protein n=1 Tax=Chromobacterium vaccinii TaxID=1108595 RepID=UPI003C75034F